MSEHIVIDGNNLLHAMRAHAPIPQVGRETMVRIIERWAGGGENQVTLVLDGAAPAGEFRQQMVSRRVQVRFSGKATADDLIVELINKAARPDTLRVVTGDTAIRHEARRRRCPVVDPIAFIGELFPTQAPSASAASQGEKPRDVSDVDARKLQEMIEDVTDDSFDLYGF